MISDAQLAHWEKDNAFKADDYTFDAEYMPEQLPIALAHLRELISIHETRIAEGHDVEYRQYEINRLMGWAAHVEDLIRSL